MNVYIFEKEVKGEVEGNLANNSLAIISHQNSKNQKATFELLKIM